MNQIRENAFNAIQAERNHQDNKWGDIASRPHTIAEWLLIAEAELQEAKHAWAKECSDGRALEEMVQTAAVLLAALEQFAVTAIDSPTADLKQRQYTLQRYPW